MSVVLHENSRDNKLSIMNQQKTLCDGQKLGFECCHYLCMTQKVDTPTAITLTKGETSRWCTLADWKAEPLDLGDAGKDMAVYCNRYTPSTRPFDRDMAAGEYEPLTEEEIAEIRKVSGGGTETLDPTDHTDEDQPITASSEE